MEIFSLLYLIFLPLLAALLIVCPKFPNNQIIIRRFAKSFSGVHLLYALLFLLQFNPTSYTPSFLSELTIFKQSWMQTLGIKANFAVDGISLLFVILVSFVTLLVLFASRNKIAYSHKLYYSLVFTAQTSILGALCAQDMFVFFLFIELSLIPFYFLISHWSIIEDEKMARKFLGFNILGGFFILAPMLILYFYNFAITDTLSASIETLNFDNFSYPDWFKLSVFSAFMVGFLIRMGVFPFHNWLIECIETAKTPISMFLISAFSLSGLYGILKFNMSAFPDTYADFNGAILILALCGFIYLSLILTTQKHLKKIFAYWGVLQYIIALIGLSCLNSVAYVGSIMHIMASLLSVCGLFMLAQILQRREKTYILPLSQNILDKMPKFKPFAYIIFFASILVPFLFNSTSLYLLICGGSISDLELSMTTKFILAFTLLMMFIVVVYMISVFHQMCFSHSKEINNRIKDITLSEMTFLSFVTGTILFFGIFPTGLVDIINSCSHFIINIFRI
ncbi:hypothetical protein J6Q66_03380 [bacterium]|nr:hypothetical protein [bacterium]